MQQHDGSVMYPRQQLGECLLIGRLVIRIPVHIRERPENRGIPQLLRLPEILLAELALRRTIKFLHRLTGQRGVFLLETVQLRRKRALIRNAGHIRMVQRMVAHDMPLRCHALYEFRCGINKVAHYEKAGRRVMLFERIQNSRRAAVLVARVKRQVDGLSARVTDVKRIVLPQFLGGDIAGRRLTLGLERQSPVADRRGNRLFGGCWLSIFARKQDENRGQNRKNAKSHTNSAQTRACDRDKHSSALPCSTLCARMDSMTVFARQFAPNCG